MEKALQLYEDGETIVDLEPFMIELEYQALEGVHNMASKSYFSRLFSVKLNSLKVTVSRDKTLEDDEDEVSSRT